MVSRQHLTCQVDMEWMARFHDGIVVPPPPVGRPPGVQASPSVGNTEVFGTPDAISSPGGQKPSPMLPRAAAEAEPTDKDDR